MTDIKLPEGWTMEPWCEAWVLTRGDGFVSVDFRRRSFAPGYSNVLQTTATPTPGASGNNALSMTLSSIWRMSMTYDGSLDAAIT